MRQIDDEQDKRLGKLLGTRWTVKEIRHLAANNKPSSNKIWKPDDEIVIPLTIALNNEFMKSLGDLVGSGEIGGGEYRPGENEQVVELGELSKDDYLQTIRNLFSGAG